MAFNGFQLLPELFRGVSACGARAPPSQRLLADLRALQHLQDLVGIEVGHPFEVFGALPRQEIHVGRQLWVVEELQERQGVEARVLLVPEMKPIGLILKISTKRGRVILAYESMDKIYQSCPRMQCS